MISEFKIFKNLIERKDFQRMNQKYVCLIKKINFIFFKNQDDYPDESISKIREDDFIIIDFYSTAKEKCIIICCNEQLILIDQNESACQTFFSKILNKFTNKDHIFLINDHLDEFGPFFQNFTFATKKDAIFKKEIIKFSNSFQLFSQQDKLQQIFRIIRPCLSGYLIKKSYFENRKYQLNEILSHIEENIFYDTILYQEKEFIKLRVLGAGCTSSVELWYHIEKGQLFAVKMQNSIDEQLNKREIDNYAYAFYPYIPKYYGEIKASNQIILITEFIQGESLENISKLNFSFEQKMSIILQILFIFRFLHYNKKIYRDLKPNNIIINDKSIVYLIDFDRMIDDCELDISQYTRNFFHAYVAPEVVSKDLTPSIKSDIYSIGQMIYYILIEKSPNNGLDSSYKLEKNEIDKKYPIFKTLYEECIQENPNNRPTIESVIDSIKNLLIEREDCLNVNKNISILENICQITCYYADAILRDDAKAFYNLGRIYYLGEVIKQDIKKALTYFAIAADLNNLDAQIILGVYYSKGIDINLGIYYYTLAANQNHSDSQCNLGVIYFDGIYIQKDINKAIHYLTLAANQNNSTAQYNLGLIYYEHNERDMNKAIHYLTLAANLNNPLAQNKLGIIYNKGEYIERDINKSIHYLTLAANQNNLNAQFNLGMIYYSEKSDKRDINKSIHYLTLAADQNHSEAQNALGVFYDNADYAERNINKAIHYFTLAANQNNSNAQNNLGIIYNRGIDIQRNINKSIHYFTLAANQNNHYAQKNLGIIYCEGKYVKQDMEKAIHYLTLAADQNDVEAQSALGFIYLNGLNNEIDIKKAIHYFVLAANQNEKDAQFILGRIYFEGKYIMKDITKSIYYFTLAANQNHTVAQNDLGFIYYEGKYVKQDMEKAIYYLTLSANQNFVRSLVTLSYIYFNGEYIQKDISKAINYAKIASNLNEHSAQTFLGQLYLEGEYVEKDINKGIFYLTLAANKNHLDALHYLAKIYYEGKYVQKDINKTIKYLSLASQQNSANAQYSLGIIFYEGKYIARDIRRSIYYLNLASNQNVSDAQSMLGLIYYEGKFITKNIDKALFYFSLASNQNDSNAQYFLGIIYYEGKYIKRDINRSIHYLKLASNHNQKAQCQLGLLYFKEKEIDNSIHYFKLASKKNCAFAQYSLGYIYFNGKYVIRDIKTGINYLELAGKNEFRQAQLYLGDIYFEGKFVSRDINKAVHFYKLLSNIYDNHAKNNLGVIYKNGFDGIEKNIQKAKEYFSEAIKYQNCEISMYNLANIFFDEATEYDKKYDEGMKLLIESSSHNFIFSMILIYMLIYIKHGKINKNIIKEEVQKYKKNATELIISTFERFDFDSFIENENYTFDQIFQVYRQYDFVIIYNETKPLFYINTVNFTGYYQKKNKQIEINEEFYHGFGDELL